MASCFCAKDRPRHAVVPSNVHNPSLPIKMQCEFCLLTEYRNDWMWPSLKHAAQDASSLFVFLSFFSWLFSSWSKWPHVTPYVTAGQRVPCEMWAACIEEPLLTDTPQPKRISSAEQFATAAVRWLYTAVIPVIPIAAYGPCSHSYNQFCQCLPTSCSTLTQKCCHCCASLCIVKQQHKKVRGKVCLYTFVMLFWHVSLMTHVMYHAINVWLISTEWW